MFSGQKTNGDVTDARFIDHNYSHQHYFLHLYAIDKMYASAYFVYFRVHKLLTK